MDSAQEQRIKAGTLNVVATGTWTLYDGKKRKTGLLFYLSKKDLVAYMYLLNGYKRNNAGIKN